jgi:ketosteroid isomerase-like protein
VSAIAVVRQAWLDAGREGGVERLGALVTDDVAVAQGNGCGVCGKETPKPDFRKGFEAFAMEQSVASPKVIVRGRWACV